MAKITAWVVTILGILIIIAAMGQFSINSPWFLWVLGLGVLIIGVSKLVRNYSRKRK